MRFAIPVAFLVSLAAGAGISAISNRSGRAQSVGFKPKATDSTIGYRSQRWLWDSWLVREPRRRRLSCQPSQVTGTVRQDSRCVGFPRAATGYAGVGNVSRWSATTPGLRSSIVTGAKTLRDSPCRTLLN